MDFNANGGTRNDGGSAIIDALIIAQLKISNTPVDSKLNSRSITVFDIIDRILYGFRRSIRRHVIECGVNSFTWLKSKHILFKP